VPLLRLQHAVVRKERLACAMRSWLQEEMPWWPAASPPPEGLPHSLGGGTPQRCRRLLIEVTETLKQYFEFTDDIEVAVNSTRAISPPTGRGASLMASVAPAWACRISTRRCRKRSAG